MLLVSLLAEVALNCVEVRSDQELLSITESNVATRSETYDITRWRHETGLTTQLDVEQARLSLEQARGQVPALRTSLEQAKYRLAVLLGVTPGALNEMLAGPKPVPTTPAEVAVGVPAETLLRSDRPARCQRPVHHGTRLAIGALEREVLLQFLVSPREIPVCRGATVAGPTISRGEAVVLSSFGGLIGSRWP